MSGSMAANTSSDTETSYKLVLFWDPRTLQGQLWNEDSHKCLKLASMHLRPDQLLIAGLKGGPYKIFSRWASGSLGRTSSELVE